MMTTEDTKQIKMLVDRIYTAFKTANDTICGRRMAGCTGCCDRCADANSYFRYTTSGGKVLQPKDLSGNKECMRQLQAMRGMYQWDGVHGFLASDGCRLPKELRSCTCLDALCITVAQIIPQHKVTQVKEWANSIGAIRRKNGLIY